jgi:hypothetical protein
MVNKSLISEAKCCYFCGTTQNLHFHHIFQNANKKNSEKIGAWVWLCAKHHVLGADAVHNNYQKNRELKKLAQRKYEENHTRDEFMSIIKRNYLD